MGPKKRQSLLDQPIPGVEEESAHHQYTGPQKQLKQQQQRLLAQLQPQLKQTGQPSEQQQQHPKGEQEQLSEQQQLTGQQQQLTGQQQQQLAGQEQQLTGQQQQLVEQQQQLTGQQQQLTGQQQQLSEQQQLTGQQQQLTGQQQQQLAGQEQQLTGEQQQQVTGQQQQLSEQQQLTGHQQQLTAQQQQLTGQQQQLTGQQSQLTGQQQQLTGQQQQLVGQQQLTGKQQQQTGQQQQLAGQEQQLTGQQQQLTGQQQQLTGQQQQLTGQQQQLTGQQQQLTGQKQQLVGQQQHLTGQQQQLTGQQQQLTGQQQQLTGQQQHLTGQQQQLVGQEPHLTEHHRAQPSSQPSQLDFQEDHNISIKQPGHKQLSSELTGPKEHTLPHPKEDLVIPVANQTPSGSVSHNEEVLDEDVSPWTPCLQWMVVIAQLLGIFITGMNVGVIGPVLPDLSLLTGQPVDKVSTIFTWRAVTSIICPLLGGPLLDTLDPFLVIAVSLVLQGIGMAAMVFFKNLLLLCLFSAIANFFTSLVTIGTFMLSFWMKGKNARSLILAVIVFSNLGQTVVPLMAAPFLTPSQDTWPHNVSTPTTPDDYPTTNVIWVFVLIGCLSLLTSVVYFGLLCFTGCRLQSVYNQRGKEDTEKPDKTFDTYSSTKSLMTKIRIIGVYALIIIMITGLLTTDGGVLMTFTTEFLHWAKSLGVAMTSLFQGIKVFSLGVVAILIRFLHPTAIIVTSLILLCLSSALMTVTVAVATEEALLWVCVALMALGISPIYGSMMTSLDNRYPITGKLSSLSVLCFGVGSASIPPITTHLLVQIGPLAFPLVMLVGSVIIIMLFLFYWLLMTDRCCRQQAKPPGEQNVNDPEKVPILRDGTARPIYTPSQKNHQPLPGSPATPHLTPACMSINKGLYLLSREENLSGSFRKT